VVHFGDMIKVPVGADGGGVNRWVDECTILLYYSVGRLAVGCSNYSRNYGRIDGLKPVYIQMNCVHLIEAEQAHVQRTSWMTSLTP